RGMGRLGAFLLVGLTISGCGGQAETGTRCRTDYARADGFFAAPFPSESRRQPDGRVDPSGFPNPTRAGFIETLLAILTDDARGFGTTSTIYFAFDGPLEPV